ncbi:TPA: tail fiber assembly protein [Providencia alcalifaciens]
MEFYFDTSTNTPMMHNDEAELQNATQLIQITEEQYRELISISSAQIIVTDNNKHLILPAKSYYYSAKENAFYPAEMQVSYKKSGSWVSDGKWVDESVFTEFAISPAPAGKMRVAGKNGMPKWGDLPKPTKEHLIAESEQQKQSLADEAEKNITILERKVRLGMATGEEIDLLTAWEIYSIKVSDIDTSLAPEIDWPQKP